MSSSHLFLGLPNALLVLYLELRPKFHSAAFFSHLSHGEVAILSANFHFIFLCAVPASNLCAFHLVHCIYSAFMCSIQSSPRHHESLCSDHRRFRHQCYTFR